MSKLTLPVVLLLLTVLCSSSLEAGMLYARRPNTVSPLYNLTLSSVQTSISIDNLLAVVHVDEEFINTTNLDLEGYYVFQLPENALVDGLWVWIDGKRTSFIVKRKEEAQHIYDSLVQHGVGEPAILETLGANRFQLKITPIKAGSKKRIELRYFHTIPMNIDGIADFYYPLSHKSYQSAPISVVNISVDLVSSFPFQNLATNYDLQPHIVGKTKLSENHYSISFGSENVAYDQDLHITFKPVGWQETLPYLDYAYPDTTDDGYFMMWCPMKQVSATGAATDYILAIDASASMCGLRQTTMKLTVADILSRLQPYDRFKIVLFSNSARSLPVDTSMLFATTKNIAEAISYLDKAYIPKGTTNYQAAFVTGSMMSAFRSNAIHRMIMVTDGLPNAGGRTTAELDNFIGNVILCPVSVYTERIGMLDSLAKNHGGFLTTIEQGDDLQNIITRMAFHFNNGLFTDISLALPNNTYLVLPDSIPTSSYGNDILIAGRFQETGVQPFGLTYKDNSTSYQTSSADIDLRKTDAHPMQVAKYWGALRIQHLLYELKQSPGNQENIEAVIRLSEYFNILSPYTAFIVYKEVEPPLSVESTLAGALPVSCRLFQNYPNPFNPSTTISYYIPRNTSPNARVTLHIYDIEGRLIRTLYAGKAIEGYHSIVWNGIDDTGNPVPSGVYICTLQMGTTSQSINLILAK